MDQLLTVAEIAVLFNFTKKWVYTQVENGKLPHVRIGNRLRFVPDEVMEYVRERRVPTLEN